MGAARRVKYPAELRERAVRMVQESTPEHESPWAAMRSVAQMLGIGSTETVRKWVRQAEASAVRASGGSAGPAAGRAQAEESAEMRRLKREVAELRRANEILKAAAGFFAAELDRPHRSW
jgi:transposase